MTALDHALKWIDGELVAGGALVAFGLLLVVCGGSLWRFGESAAARAMVAPLLLMGGLIAVLSAVGVLNNVRRIAEFREAYAVDPLAFVEQEVARVQGFMSWYVYTFVGASILIVAGLAAFLIAGAPLWKAIGLALIVLGAAALHVDFFSKASATQYLANLALLDGAPAAAGRTPASSGAAIRRGGTTRDAGESAGGR